MSNVVRFTIDGDNAAALRSLTEFDAKLTAIGKNPAFTRLLQSTQALRTGWKDVGLRMRDAQADARRLNTQLHQMANSVTRIATNQQGLATPMNAAAAAQTKMIAGARQHLAAAVKVQSTWEKVGEVVEAVVRISARGLSQSTASLRGGATSIAGSVQGVGISTRMSGIALSQQLSSIFSGPLSGNILSPLIEGLRNAISVSAGILTIGAEMGVRIVTGLAGGIVKAGGLLIGGALQTAFSIGAGVLSLGGRGIFNAMTLGLLGVGSALNNIISSVATVAGEMVGQVGNVLTGLGEAFRGAFQAAVNIAGSILNSLVTVAQEVVGTIAGAFGTIAKGVFGALGVVGGFAAHGIIKAEGALTKGLILLDPSVTPEQKDSLRKWVTNMRREFSNLGPEAPGEALERIISTGFQSRPDEAAPMARSALALASAGGEQSAGQIARAMAKIMLPYRDEIEAQAKLAGTDAGTVLADKLFAMKNFGDVDIPQIASRLGDLTGAARETGMTFDQLASTFSKLTLILGVEQSFTGMAQMLDVFKTLGPKGREVLERHGISYKTLSASQKTALDGMVKEVKTLEEQRAGTKKLSADREKLVLKAKQERLLKKDDTATRKQILALDQQIAAQGKGKVSEREKFLQGEIDRTRELTGVMRPLMDIYTELLQKAESGDLSSFEMQKVVDNIRAARGVLGLATLQKISPEEAAAVDAGIRNSAGGVARAGETRQNDVGFKLSQVMIEIQQPFTAFYDIQRKEILAVFDSMVSGLKGFNQNVQDALNADGFVTFAQNLKAKVGGLFSNLFQGSGGKFDPAAFWTAMNSGLDKFWTVASSVISGIGTIGGMIGDAVSQSGTLQGAWSGIKDAMTSVGEVIAALGKGDTSPLGKMLGGLETKWRELKSGAVAFAASLSVTVVGAIGSVSEALNGLLEKMSEIARMFSFGVGGLFLGKYLAGTGQGAPGVSGVLLGKGGKGVPGGGGGGGGGFMGGTGAEAALTVAALTSMRPGRDRVSLRGTDRKGLWYRRIESEQERLYGYPRGTVGIPGERPTRQEFYNNRQRKEFRDQGLPPYRSAFVPFIGPLAQGHTTVGNPVHKGTLTRFKLGPAGLLPGRGTPPPKTFTGAVRTGVGRVGGGLKSGAKGLSPLLSPLGLMLLLGYAGSGTNKNAGNSVLDQQSDGDIMKDELIGAFTPALITAHATKGNPWATGAAAVGGMAYSLYGGSKKAAVTRRNAQRVTARGMQENVGKLSHNPYSNLEGGFAVDQSTTSAPFTDMERSNFLELVQSINQLQKVMNDVNAQDSQRSAAAAMAEVLIEEREGMVQAAKDAAVVTKQGARADDAMGLVTALADAFPDEEMERLRAEIERLADAIASGALSPLEGALAAQDVGNRATARASSPSYLGKRLSANIGTPLSPEAAKIFEEQFPAGLAPANLHSRVGLPEGFTPGTITVPTGKITPAQIAKKAGILPNIQAGVGQNNTSITDPSAEFNPLDPFAPGRMQTDDQGRRFFDLGGGKKHFFNKLTKSDPFKSGSFGTRTGSLGTDIGESNSAFGVFKPAPGTSGFASPSGGSPSGAVASTQENYAAFKAKLSKAAASLSETAAKFTEGGDTEAAAKATEAAEKFKAAAEGIKTNAGAVGKQMVDMGKQMADVAKTSNEALLALESANEALRVELDALKETVAGLESQQQKGGE